MPALSRPSASVGRRGHVRQLPLARPPRPADREDSVRLPCVLLTEPLNSASGVNQLLLTGIERVAVGADVEMELARCRSRLKRVPARAMNGCCGVFRMDIGL